LPYIVSIPIKARRNIWGGAQDEETGATGKTPAEFPDAGCGSIIIPDRERASYPNPVFVSNIPRICRSR
jgi:hypothetical protein